LHDTTDHSLVALDLELLVLAVGNVASNLFLHLLEQLFTLLGTQAFLLVIGILVSFQTFLEVVQIRPQHNPIDRVVSLTLVLMHAHHREIQRTPPHQPLKYDHQDLDQAYLVDQNPLLLRPVHQCHLLFETQLPTLLWISQHLHILIQRRGELIQKLLVNRDQLLQ